MKFIESILSNGKGRIHFNAEKIAYVEQQGNDECLIVFDGGIEVCVIGDDFIDSLYDWGE